MSPPRGTGRERAENEPRTTVRWERVEVSRPLFPMQTFSALSKTEEGNAKELSCVAKPLLEKALFLTAVTWHKKAPLSIIPPMRSHLKKHGKVNFVLRLYVKRNLIFRRVLFYCLGFLSETSLIEYFLRFLVSKGPQWDIYEALILGGTKGSSYKVKIQNSKLNFNWHYAYLLQNQRWQ